MKLSVAHIFVFSFKGIKKYYVVDFVSIGELKLHITFYHVSTVG